LTELVNRREFERQLNLLVSDRRSNACALFVDLDYFKLVNDGAGHAAGDVLLKRIAYALQKQVRTGDTVGRVGGDEFAVLLRGCGLQQALQLAENARAQVELYGICEADPSLRVTASIGVVEINATHRSLADVLEAADQACYEAKHAGRNAVRHAAIEPIEAQPSL
jgi:diguanylate cyclase (GGDEF)-like protein